MKVLKAIAIAVLIIGAILGYALRMNAQASRKAEQFCSSISVGEPVVEVLRRPHQRSGIAVIEGSDSGILFVFQGFGYCRATCAIKTENGHVKSKGFRKAYD